MADNIKIDVAPKKVVRSDKPYFSSYSSDVNFHVYDKDDRHIRITMQNDKGHYCEIDIPKDHVYLILKGYG